MSLKSDLKKSDIVVRGEVKLTSGKTSDFYCDFKKIYDNPKLLKRVVSFLAEEIKSKQLFGVTQGLTTCVAAMGHGGIPLATAVSLNLNLPLTLIRGEKRTHGLKKNIEGYVPSAKDCVAIIDDVCAYGTSLTKIIDALSDTKSKISGCYVVILRPEVKLPFKYPIFHLIKAEELLRK